MLSATAEAERNTTHHTVDEDLRDDVRTVLALHKTALQQQVAMISKDCERVLADKPAILTEFRKFTENI